MRAIAAGLSDVGKKRAHNEDRFLLLPQHSLFVVADGMGGHRAGEVASRMAVSTIASFFRIHGSDANGHAAAVLYAAVARANEKIFSRGEDSALHQGMGTTLVAAVYAASERKLHIAHAGDSRCYRIRGDEIVSLTRDHSLFAEATLERPDLSELELSFLPKNVLTRALGTTPDVEIEMGSTDVEVGDVFLLCSDGLHGLVDDPAMAEIVAKHIPLTEACAKLVEEANRAGGKDNITAVLVRIEEDDEPWSQRAPGSLAPQKQERAGRSSK